MLYWVVFCTLAGDLDYKNNRDLDATKQSVIAKPDISETILGPNDEFVVLACDGVWEVYTSDAVVEFLSKSLKEVPEGAKLSSVVEQLLDWCMTKDPRTTRGIGADNITCIVVVLHMDSFFSSSDHMAAGVNRAFMKLRRSFLNKRVTIASRTG